MKKNKGKYDPRNKLNSLTGSEWLSNSTSIWSSKSSNTKLEKQEINKLVKLFTKNNSRVGIINFDLSQKTIAGRSIVKSINQKEGAFDYLLVNDPLVNSKNIRDANSNLLELLAEIVKFKKCLKINKYISFFISEHIVEETNLNISFHIHEILRNNGYRFKGRVNVIFSDNSVGYILHFKLVNLEITNAVPKKVFKKRSSSKMKNSSNLTVIRSRVKTDAIGKQHPAPYSPMDIELLIEHFTKKNDTILDPFVGVGSTTIAAIAKERKSIGIDLNSDYIKLAYERTGIDKNDKFHQLVVGNSLNEIKKLKEIDYCVTSPPYHNILKNHGAGVRHDKSQFRQGVQFYSDRSEDLGNQETLAEYRELFKEILRETYLKLKPKSYLSIVVSDFTVDRIEQDIVGQLISDIEEIGYIYKKLFILTQNFKAIFPFGYPYDYVINHVNQYIVNFYKK